MPLTLRAQSGILGFLHQIHQPAATIGWFRNQGDATVSILSSSSSSRSLMGQEERVFMPGDSFQTDLVLSPHQPPQCPPSHCPQDRILCVIYKTLPDLVSFYLLALSSLSILYLLSLARGTSLINVTFCYHSSSLCTSCLAVHVLFSRAHQGSPGCLFLTPTAKQS